MGSDRTQFGFTLSSEEFGPRELIELAVRADEAGFDFATVSDHFHPWTSTQGHSPFVWSTLGGAFSRTTRLPIGTGVTCPIIRIHPAVIAQASATTAVLAGDRFFLGVGTGEALNEHITGARWPRIEERQQMLIEAISIIRALWTGETVDHAGTYYSVDNARIFTAPDTPPQIIVAAGGEGTAKLAAEHGDGMWVTSPDADVVRAYRDNGGTGPIYGQVTVCWAATEEEGRETALRIWPTAGFPGQLNQDLPTPTHFEQVSELVTADRVAQRVAAGPDVEAHVGAVRPFLDAGFTHIHFHQVGQQQEEFIRFWLDELHPALVATASPRHESGPSSATNAMAPSDRTTLTDVLAAYQEAGFDGEFELVLRSGDLRCLACGTVSDPASVAISSRRRLEGASDPADMLSVLALACPACHAKGVLVLHFGPEATAEDVAFMARVRDERGQDSLPADAAPDEEAVRA